MHIKAWNDYTVQQTGKLIIGYNVEVNTITEALDVAEKDAKAWNKRHNRKNQEHQRVNFVTCNGHIRNV